MGAVAALAYAWVFGSTLGGPAVREAGFAYRIVFGLIGMAAVIVTLGSASLWLPSMIFGLPAIALAMVIFARRDRYAQMDWKNAAWPRGWVEVLALSVSAIALALGFLQALAPSTSWDAAVAHLALPADFVRAGRIELSPGNAYSGYPLLVHCLYTYAFGIGGETSVQLTAWVLAALACAMVFDLARQVAGRRAGFIAASIMATAPLFAEQAGVASLDVALASVVAGALAQWLRWHDTSERRFLILAGLLCGGACGIRHTGFLVCAIVIVGTLVRSVWIARRATALKAPLLVGVSMAVAAAPWILRSAIVTGNPVYPFFMDVFGDGAIHHTAITALGAHESIKGNGFWYFVTFPWNLVMHPERFDGWSKSPGGLVLILGVPGLFLGGAKARWLGVFTLCGLLAFYHFQHLARYMLPFFVPMMAAAAATCVAPRWRKVALPVWGVSVVMGLVVAGAMMHFKIPVALGFEDRDAYLTRRVERYPAFAWINDTLPDDAGVLTLDPRSYYVDRRSFQNYEELKAIRALPVEEQLAWLRDHGLHYVLYPQAYLEESPGFGEEGYLDQFAGWREDSQRFPLVIRFALERPKGGTEVVEVYEIRVD